ncbi:MAG: hypothetical protein ABFD46_04205 [Armatimonadota bacterium]
MDDIVVASRYMFPPEGDTSKLLISMQGGDTLAKTAMKWVNRIYDELGIEDE